MSGIARLLKSLPPAPCEKGCGLREQCAARLLSCNAFVAYFTLGISHARMLEDEPTKALYSLQLTDEDDPIDEQNPNYRAEMKATIKATMKSIKENAP